MDDAKKKKKFSFLRALGLSSDEPKKDVKNGNKFSVVDAANTISKRKKMLEEMAD